MIDDELNAALIDNLKNGGNNVNLYIKRLVSNGAAENIFEGLELIADPELEVSLMAYLVRKERFEEAAWLKRICDKVRETLITEKHEGTDHRIAA